MKRTLIGLIFGVLIGASFSALGGNLPPPLVVEDKETLLYLRKIAEEWQNLEVVTTNPDGSRVGRIGDMLLLSTGGNFYLEVNVSTGASGGTTWLGEQLTDTP